MLFHDLFDLKCATARIGMLPTKPYPRPVFSKDKGAFESQRLLRKHGIRET